MPRTKVRTVIGSYLENEFTRFWAAYPKRVARKDAEKAFAQLQPTTAIVNDMIAAVARQVYERAVRAKRGQWVPEWPYPATWLRGERWNDEPLTSTPTPTRYALLGAHAK